MCSLRDATHLKMDADLIYAEKMDMGDNRKGRGDGHLKKIGIFTL